MKSSINFVELGFVNAADVLTRRGNPLGLGIRIIICKVGTRGLTLKKFYKLY